MIYVLKVAYDGAFFVGVQRQPYKDTVMGDLETLLTRYFSEPIKTSVAGRTDTGVHALGQVIAFQSEQIHDLEKLTHSLNAMARSPLAVLESALLDDESAFHPRHCALSRTYQYLVVDDCSYSQRLLWRGRAWTVGPRLDMAAMNQAAGHFVGTHDFTTYSYQPDEDMARVREVTDFSIREEAIPEVFSGSGPTGRLLRIEITANGFLRRMVRALTSELVRIGAAIETAESAAEKLAACDPELGPPPAPAHGLYFKSAFYSPDPFELGKTVGRYRLARPSTSLNFQDQSGRLN
ncbi:MAG: tRNA pseudouridine synthase A [Candidatus Eremiobacteraeota bacterium]|nr:tRNA pseudouridine synthase A [Candidatus Eremiobacteraeota bacterium]